MKGYCIVNEIFTDDCIQKLKTSLLKSRGQEVFWGCFLNEEKTKISRVDDIFYGSYQSVVFDKNISSKYDLVLHNHPSNIIEPSEEDQQIAFICLNLGVGFAIIDNNFNNCYVLIPPRNLIKREKIDENQIIDILKNPDNNILNELPNYRIRESQIELTSLVQNIINNDKTGFIEAPTGIGKSIAYLLPSILYADKNKVKFIISTYTKNLQNQLIKKDIKSASKILKKEISVEVAYGRQNYLCLLAYNNYKQNFNYLMFESLEDETIKNLDNWLEKTSDGLLLELTNIYNKNIIDEIRSNSNLCLANKCKFFSECFFYNSKRKLNNADIIVSNHHLLLSYELIEDLTNFFPDYNTIIFDEAHNLPDVIESISSFTFSTFEIQKKIFKLVNPSINNHGLLHLLEINLMKSNKSNNAEIKKISKISNNIKEEALELLKLIGAIQNNYIYEIIDIVKSNFKVNLNNKILINFNELRKTNSLVLKDIYELFKEPFEKIHELKESTTLMLQLLSAIISNNDDKEQSFIHFFYASVKSINSFLNNIDQFYFEFTNLFIENIQLEKLLKVLWVEIFNNIVYFNFYDEEKGLSFNNIIENKTRSSIFISATLSTNNTFDYIKEQLYLSNKIKSNSIEKIFPSIFPYEQNSSIFIIKGINPLEKTIYKKDISEIIINVLKTTNAKTMILTTSYSDINEIAQTINENIFDLRVLSQNENFFTYNLIDEFKKNNKSVLIANMSFWEGIDLPGKDLEILIITKLPFKVPDTPILKAKAQRLDNEGLNSFMKLSLPYAIIKLKQGFGRLIRSEDEKGICILLDDRIITKKYGENILKSLPKIKTEVVLKEKFLEKFKSRCSEYFI